MSCALMVRPGDLVEVKGHQVEVKGYQVASTLAQ